MARTTEKPIEREEQDQVLSVPSAPWTFDCQCFELKEEIEVLIRKGKLRKYVKNDDQHDHWEHEQPKPMSLRVGQIGAIEAEPVESSPIDDVSTIAG